MFLTLLSNSSYSRIHHAVLFHAEWAGDEMGNKDRDWALVKDEPPGGKGNGSGVPTAGKEPGPGYRLYPPGGTATKEEKLGRHFPGASRKFAASGAGHDGVGEGGRGGWQFLSVYTFASMIPAPFEFLLFLPLPLSFSCGWGCITAASKGG